MKFVAVPLHMKFANAFVERHHRHSVAVRGCKFCIGALHDNELVGVAIVGRPVARHLQDGWTAEVLRVCVIDEAPKNVGSFLYARCRAAWLAMGGRKLVTYTLQSESGASLRGAGYRIIAERPARSGWDTPARRRGRVLDTDHQSKFRWEAGGDKNLEGDHPEGPPPPSQSDCDV